MEIDTGAAFSLVAEDVYHQNWGDKSLMESKINLRTYSGGQISVLECLNVNAEYQGQKAVVPLLVVLGKWSQPLWSGLVELLQAGLEVNSPFTRKLS